MKRILFLGVILALGIAIIGACCKPRPTNGCREGYTKAIITGYDMRKCACCGGLMVTFSNDPTPYSSDFVLVESMPRGTAINESSQFPIYVCVKYQKIQSPCGTNPKINITELVRTN